MKRNKADRRQTVNRVVLSVENFHFTKYADILEACRAFYLPSRINVASLALLLIYNVPCIVYYVAPYLALEKLRYARTGSSVKYSSIVNSAIGRVKKGKVIDQVYSPLRGFTKKMKIRKPSGRYE